MTKLDKLDCGGEICLHEIHTLKNLIIGRICNPI